MIKTSSGRSLDRIAHLIQTAAGKVSRADGLLVGEGQRTRILGRTSRGVDVDEKGFAGYSTKGPYYYNPNGRLSAGARSEITDKQQRGAVSRLKRRVGGGLVSKTGKTLKFASYAAFKRWLGRGRVDLRGPRAPHMLQSPVVKVEGPPDAITAIRVGIYGPAADRASGHNSGAGHLPRRRFFGASRKDLSGIAKMLAIAARKRIVGKD